MNERGKELLSAFLDDSLADGEVAELARLWTAHPELGAEGVRYLQLGELLRAGAGAGATASAAQLLVARVHTAVTAEPAPALEPMAPPAAGTAVTATPARGRRRLPRPVIGLALAAGIALVAVGALRLLNSETPGSVSEAALAAGEPAAAARMGSAGSAGQHAAFRWSVSEPNVERRLNRYLVNHSEVTRSGTHGMLPYARVVGYRAAAPAPRP